MTPPDPHTGTTAGLAKTLRLRNNDCWNCGGWCGRAVAENCWLKACHEGARDRLERREQRIAFLEIRIKSQECGDA